jgi:hypothetical protein
VRVAAEVVRLQKLSPTQREKSMPSVDRSRFIF